MIVPRRSSHQQGSLEPLWCVGWASRECPAGKQAASELTYPGRWAKGRCSDLRGSEQCQPVAFIFSKPRASGHLLSARQLHHRFLHFKKKKPVSEPTGKILSQSCSPKTSLQGLRLALIPRAGEEGWASDFLLLTLCCLISLSAGAASPLQCSQP